MVKIFGVLKGAVYGKIAADAMRRNTDLRGVDLEQTVSWPTK
jgi:hypothetical protein